MLRTSTDSSSNICLIHWPRELVKNAAQVSGFKEETLNSSAASRHSTYSPWSKKGMKYSHQINILVADTKSYKDMLRSLSPLKFIFFQIGLVRFWITFSSQQKIAARQNQLLSCGECYHPLHRARYSVVLSRSIYRAYCTVHVPRILMWGKLYRYSKHDILIQHIERIVFSSIYLNDYNSL